MPKKTDEPRAATQMVGLQLRFQEQMRAKLETAAKANGTSLNSEVVARLDRSLEDDARGGSHETSRFLIALASDIAVAEKETGKSWQQDAEAYYLARLLMHRTIAAHDPVSEDHKAYFALKAERDKAKERRDFLDKVLTACRVINRNALSLLLPERAHHDFHVLDEQKWIDPETPETPISDELRTALREALAEFQSLQKKIDAMLIQITNLRAPISVAKDRALATYARLTAPAEV